jgi:ABC-type sugar transport system ATPase subunit
MLRFELVSKRFSGTQALSNISFEVQRGEIHALVGENGAGKSTLMKILSGVHTDYEGTIYLEGQPVRFSGTRDAQDAGISIIHQELQLVPELTIAENIFLGREPRRAFGMIATREMVSSARLLLDQLGLRVSPNRKVSSLRVGEQQLTEVAKALSLNTQLLILDEPTSALSQTEIQRLFRVIAGLKERGVTMIYISHKFDEIFQLADRITVLRDGKYIMTVPKDETTESRIIQAMVGRELSDFFPKDTTPQDSEMMRVEHLSLSPGALSENRSLHDISFSLRHGEILGVAGLMGSGRTELLESIFGNQPHSQVAGAISVEGQPVHISSPHDALAHGIALVTEDRKSKSLVLPLTVTENLTLSALAAFCQAGVVRRKRERLAVGGMVSSLRIKTPGLASPIESLSGGNQQKVVLGKCLLSKPRILLLDEPTRGIDVGAKAEIYALMSQLATQGMSIIMASSELPELLAMCDRILVLHNGRLAATISQEEANQVNIMEAATGRPSVTAA